MEHSTISIEQAQRIIAASQFEGVPCIPRPVSHSNDYLKPLLESGADGLLIQMVETADQVQSLINDIKYPPVGKRTYGVNRAQSYGFDFDKYIGNWNQTSSFLLQIESIKGVENIEELLSFD
jgi:2-dehydro-3-deoxyglucarate aldolase